MTDTNIVVLIGNLTKDAEFSALPQTGVTVASFAIAVNRSKKNGDQWINEPSFFDISLFGKMAESLKPYLKKGKKVAVNGFLKQDRWEKDGQKYSRIRIIATGIQLCGERAENNGNSGNGNYQQNSNNSAAPENYGNNQDYSAENYGEHEDIPF